MENERRETAPYDYRKHDKVWQRVAPSLSPYPGDGPLTPPPEEQTLPQPVPQAMVRREEAQLPGAEPNPCCMGTQARDDLAVLEGFVEEELCQRRNLLFLSRQAPAAARQPLREAARQGEDRARRLMTVYYLITGACFRPAVSCGPLARGSYCAVLRQRYHEAACQWMNYIRAAEGTADPCLQKVFREMAEEQERLSRMLTELLGRALNGACGPGGTGV
ncbi:ferritin-like domain-containing protein [Dysosmobacter sp.]|uniref:ferritin-like domain-containing protein n=1 Tax=Dysosmobacter sp. TaxID=2591382 RepID=UPI002A8DF2FB|nr:ferritin-like domain-containing protein [Dysosmobacter sp.]MDY3282484.1 ferritin-like domain-containing protein [Dysosmobacter sp.]